MIRLTVSVFCLIVCGAADVAAQTQAEKIKTCLTGNLAKEQRQELALDMATWSFAFSDYEKDNIALCFKKVTGKKTRFVNGKGLLLEGLGLEPLIEHRAIEQAKKSEAEQETQRLAAEAIKKEEAYRKEEIKKAEYLARVAKEQAETREIEKCRILQEREELQIRSQSITEALKDLTNQIEAANEARVREVISETNSQCNDWYKSDKRAALTNELCNRILMNSGLPDSSVEFPPADSLVDAQVKLKVITLKLRVLDRKLSEINSDERFAKNYSEEALAEKKLKEQNRQENQPVQAESNLSKCEKLLNSGKLTQD